MAFWFRWCCCLGVLKVYVGIERVCVGIVRGCVVRGCVKYYF